MITKIKIKRKNKLMGLVNEKVYITPLRHERMRMWLDLDPTCGMAVTKGREALAKRSYS